MLVLAFGLLDVMLFKSPRISSSSLAASLLFVATLVKLPAPVFAGNVGIGFFAALGVGCCLPVVPDFFRSSMPKSSD